MSNFNINVNNSTSFNIDVSTTSYQLKRWTGTEWVLAKLNIYIGGTFQSKTLKVRVGSEWISVTTA